MQTSHTTASAAATTSLARRIVAASWKPVLFAVLMWLSAAAGEIPIPGTPVPITLQYRPYTADRSEERRVGKEC